jgi:hypothetical protein
MREDQGAGIDPIFFWGLIFIVVGVATVMIVNWFTGG